MPYLTEELYQRLPHTDSLRYESIVISSFPQHSNELSYDFAVVDADMNQLLTTIKAFRSQIAAYAVQGNIRPTIVVQTSNAHLLQMFKQEVAVISSLVKADETLIIAADQEPPAGCLKGFVNEEISIYVKVVGLIDIQQEINRINKRVKELETLKTNQQKKMNIPNYETKVPADIREANIEKIQGYDNELAE